MMGETGFVEMPLVIGEKRGTAGLVKLNRAKALNSLNLDMVRQMTALLAAYAEDESIVSVIVLGEGERAFCAGYTLFVQHDGCKPKTCGSFVDHDCKKDNGLNAAVA